VPAWFILVWAIPRSIPARGDDDEARHRREGDRRHRGGQGRRRHRRRGPGERGRPDLRRREGDAGAGGVHGPLHLGLPVRAAGRPDLRPAGPAAHVRGEPGQARHRLHGHRRRPSRRRDRHLRVGPGGDDAPAGRPRQRTRGLHQARARGAAAGQGRGGAAPAGSHRGSRRPGPDGRAAAGRGDLRDRQPEGRGRDGPDRRAAHLRRRAQPGDDLDRRPDRLPAQARPASRPATASSARSATPASTTASSTSPWSGGISRAPTGTGATCWSGCIRSA